ncbi:uncharacterized protein BDZ99DRAFT_493876 [Mytilinidion resinicola]|uniref:Cora-domain-containing protein n=1 Tax=Mytilinidion resinicola TaxID=574789 RepID=A0A6A6Z6Q3_9PEZI|nr:uncharacterized protein BDZ99DRAFT_493876 [Mytilinidion resinicola]KAF2815947.1 hypothetical protein BDZ99DRAFT_493876 [Mytilinidion resinicola]
MEGPISSASRSVSSPTIARETAPQPSSGRTVEENETHVRAAREDLARSDAIRTNPEAAECFDIFSKSETPKLVASFSHGDWTQNHAEALKTDKLQPDHFVRLFLIEDLSPCLMRQLSSTFDLSLEAFEEHLYGSHYSAERASHPAKWSTANMDKQHMPMTWYRPVRWDFNLMSYDEIEYQETHDDRTRPKLHPSFPISQEYQGERESRQKYSCSYRIKPNVIRSAWKFSRDPAFSKTTDANTHSILAWEEKITLIKHRVESGPQRKVFVLLDPLPEVERTRVRVPWTVVRPSDQWDTYGSDQPLFQTLYPRRCWRNTVSLDLVSEVLKTINSSLNVPSCALEDIVSWLCPSNPSIGQDLGPTPALLQVVLQDSMSLLGSLRMSLDEIRLNRDSANEHAIQQSVDHWRRLIAPVDIILPKLEENLESFMQFAYPERIPPPARRLAGRLQSDLRADISIIESRRGIAAAESVTKVTELAFVFVPLSFSAGIFSMQIKEMRNGAPLYAFVVAATVVVVLSYSVRLIVRSRATVRIIDGAFAGIRKDAGLLPGDNVPTRAALLWVLTNVPKQASLVLNRVLKRILFNKMTCCPLVGWSAGSLMNE